MELMAEVNSWTHEVFGAVLECDSRSNDLLVFSGHIPVDCNLARMQIPTAVFTIVSCTIYPGDILHNRIVMYVGETDCVRGYQRALVPVRSVGTAVHPTPHPLRTPPYNYLPGDDYNIRVVSDVCMDLWKTEKAVVTNGPCCYHLSFVASVGHITWPEIAAVINSARPLVQSITCSLAAKAITIDMQPTMAIDDAYTQQITAQPADSLL